MRESNTRVDIIQLTVTLAPGCQSCRRVGGWMVKWSTLASSQDDVAARGRLCVGVLGHGQIILFTKTLKNKYDIYKVSATTRLRATICMFSSLYKLVIVYCTDMDQ